jgi:hypothetical protein
MGEWNTEMSHWSVLCRSDRLPGGSTPETRLRSISTVLLPSSSHGISLVTAGRDLQLLADRDGEMMGDLYAAINDAIAARG